MEKYIVESIAESSKERIKSPNPSFAGLYSILTDLPKERRFGNKIWAIIHALGELAEIIDPQEPVLTLVYKYVGTNIVVEYRECFPKGRYKGRYFIVYDRNMPDNIYYSEYCEPDSANPKPKYESGEWEIEFEQIYKRAYEVGFKNGKDYICKLELENNSISEFRTFPTRELAEYELVNLDLEIEINSRLCEVLNYFVSEFEESNSDFIIDMGGGITIKIQKEMNNEYVVSVIVDGSIIFVEPSTMHINEGKIKLKRIKIKPGYWTNRFCELAEEYLEKRKANLTIESSEHGEKKLVCIENKSE